MANASDHAVSQGLVFSHKRNRSELSLDERLFGSSHHDSRIKRSSSTSSFSYSSHASSSSSLRRSPALSRSSSFHSLSSSSSSSSNSSSDSSLVLLTTQLIAYVKRRMKRRKTRRKLFAMQGHAFRKGISFKDIIRALGPQKFKASYRISLPAFKLLLNEVRDLLQRPFKAETDYRCCTVSPEIRLAITLRILGGGNYIDIMLAYRVQEATIRRIFHDTCHALSCRLRLKGFPTTIAALQEIARRFQSSRKSTNPLPGCVGALDGICIKIKKPKRHENPALFYCRKGFYAVPVQALVDSDYIFRFCSAVCTGATHDALAYSVSGLKREIDKGALFGIFYIVGDEAYTLSNSLITPCPKSNADVDQDNFNFFQSSMRMHIEQAFGMLVSRWRILRGGLQYSVAISTKIICLLMKLHNFILQNDTSKSFLIHYLSESERTALESDVNQWCRESRELAREFQSRNQSLGCEHEGTLSPVTSVSASETRDKLIAIVKSKGRERPPVQLLSYETARDPF